MSENVTPEEDESNYFPALGGLAKGFGEPSVNDLLMKNLREVLINEGGMINKNQDVFNSLYLQRSKLTSQQREIIYNDCAILNQSISKLVMEQFRNGIIISKKFEKICTVCNQEYQADIINCEAEIDNEICGGETRDPNYSHFQRLNKIQSNDVNLAGHDLETVATQVSIDVEKHDFATAIVRFTYMTDETKKALAIDEGGNYERTYESTYRGDGSRIYPSLSLLRSYDNKYSIYLVCPIHRNNIKIIKPEELDLDHFCSFDSCDFILEVAEYLLLEHEQSRNAQEGYLSGEVIRISKYDPAKIRGSSKIDTLIYSIMIVIGQEKMMAEYATDKRVPRGYFAITVGGNYESTRRQLEQEMEMFRRDPNYVPMFPLGKDGKIEFHKIDDSPLEMGWEGIREEARRNVSSSYGISNIFTNDASTGGGLNNEGLQMVVTNRAVATSHKVNNHALLKPWSAAMLGVKSDDLEYYFEHAEHEEMDKVAELQQEQMKIANANAAQQIGADVILGEDGELTKSNPIPNQPLVPMSLQQSGLGGMEGEFGMEGDTTTNPNPEGSPAEPTNGGGTDVMAKKEFPKFLKIKFIEEYDYLFDGAEDYEFKEYRTILLNHVIIPIGYKLNEPWEHPSSTMNYFIENPNIMPVIFIDEDYNLLDGFHRFKAMEFLNVARIRVAIFEDKRLLKNDENFDDDLKKKKIDWDSKSYAEQVKYLQTHKNSKRRITAKPHMSTVKGIDPNNMSRQNIMQHLISLRTHQKKLSDVGKNTTSIENKIKEFQDKLNTKTEKYKGILIYHHKKALAKKIKQSDEVEKKANTENREYKKQIDKLGSQIDEKRNNDSYTGMSALMREKSAINRKYNDNIAKQELAAVNKTLYKKMDNVTGDKAIALEISHYKLLQSQSTDENEQSEYAVKIEQMEKLTNIRADGLTWEFYDSSIKNEYDHDLVNKIDEINKKGGRMTLKTLQPLIDSELDYAKKRLGLTDENMSIEQKSILNSLKFSVDAKIGKMTNGYHSWADNEIKISSRMKDDASGIQQTIRHELAHFFQIFKDENLVKSKIIIMKQENFLKTHGNKFGKKWSLAPIHMPTYRSFTENLIKLNYTNLYNKKHQGRKMDGKDFSVGHGIAWQDTMQTVFGTKPRSRYHDKNLTQFMKKD